MAAVALDPAGYALLAEITVLHSKQEEEGCPEVQFGGEI